MAVIIYSIINIVAVDYLKPTGVYYMLLNNVEKEIKIKLVEQELTQEELAQKIGTTGQYVNRIIKKKDGIVNKTFMEMADALGYDIQLTFVPKGK